MKKIYSLFPSGELKKKKNLFLTIKNNFLCIIFIIYRAENEIKHCRVKLEGRLYSIGIKQFVSLVELIKFYENNYLYKRIKLCYPVNEDIVQRMGHVSIIHIEINNYNIKKKQSI